MKTQGTTTASERGLEVAVAAHDLRNHLTVIGAASKLVRHELLDTPEPDAEGIARLLGCMVGAVRDSRALLDELLIATGTLRPDDAPFSVAPVDLVALVRRLLALERCACETHAFHLCARVHVVGLWNEPRVARIIRNLVSNAAKYSPAGSDVMIEVDRCAENA